MATLSTSPELPARNRPVKVYVALDETGANWCRVSVTSAPPGSEQRAKLDKARLPRLEVFSGAGGTLEPWEVTFDVGGRYTFQIQEYARGASGSKGYQGAPGNAPLETKLGGEYTVTLDVGQRLTQPVGTGEDVATLVVWVWANTIRKTTLEMVGEETPAIQAESPTPRMLAAMESTAVRAAVDELAETAVGAARGNTNSIVAEMVTKINGHNALANNVHNLADAVNLIPVSYGSDASPSSLPAFVNAALKALKQHRQNDDGTGVDSVVIHNPPASSVQADFINSPIIDSVSSLGEAYAALAEIWRCQNGHVPTLVEVFNTWHGVPIVPVSDFRLTTLPALLDVHRCVFDVLAAFDPTVPPTQTSGAIELITQAGFTEN